MFNIRHSMFLGQDEPYLEPTITSCLCSSFLIRFCAGLPTCWRSRHRPNTPCSSSQSNAFSLLAHWFSRLQSRSHVPLPNVGRRAGPLSVPDFRWFHGARIEPAAIVIFTIVPTKKKKEKTAWYDRIQRRNAVNDQSDTLLRYNPTNSVADIMY